MKYAANPREPVHRRITKGPRSFGGSSPLPHTEVGGTGTLSSRKNRVWNALSARRRTRPYGGAANRAPGTSSTAYGIRSTSPSIRGISTCSSVVLDQHSRRPVRRSIEVVEIRALISSRASDQSQHAMPIRDPRSAMVSASSPRGPIQNTPGKRFIFYSPFPDNWEETFSAHHLPGGIIRTYTTEFGPALVWAVRTLATLARRTRGCGCLATKRLSITLAAGA